MADPAPDATAPFGTLITVGDRLPGWHGPLAEGGEFNLDAAGARLRLAYNRPQPAEIEAFRWHPIRIALTPAGLHTVFFLFDIAGCTAGWADATFALGMLPADERILPDRNETSGWLMTCILHDSETGIVRALRLLTMTPVFSASLDQIIAAQRTMLAHFTPDAHFTEIKRGYARWPLPDAIARHAVISETAGLPFPRRAAANPG